MLDTYRLPRSIVKRERGSILILVLLVILVIEVTVAGALSHAFSNLHGVTATTLAMRSSSIAEAGLHYGIAQLVTRASQTVPTDEAYTGERTDIAVTPPRGVAQGTFRIAVTCVHAAGGTVPPDCPDQREIEGVNERDFRRIASLGFVPDRPGRARRLIEATVRRYPPLGSDTPLYGICGRDGVDLQGESVTADVGSNSDINVRRFSSIRQWRPHAPSATAAVRGVTPATPQRSLSGTYSWRITFVDTGGQESAGSPPTPPIRLQVQQALLTVLPVGGASVTKRRIYRTRADAAKRGPWYFVAEIPDNTTRETIDQQGDESLNTRIPGPILGAAIAAGTVTCDEDCRTQVDGTTQSRVPAVVCPAFLAPPPASPALDRPRPSSLKTHLSRNCIGARCALRPARRSRSPPPTTLAHDCTCT